MPSAACSTPRLRTGGLYLSVINVSVLGANPGTPYKDAKDVVDAMKSKPGQCRSRPRASTRRGMPRSRRSPAHLGLTYKHVSYDGGNPAVVATVAGETEITTQLAVEQANMIRGKRIKPLAVLSDQPLELEGYGTIPPITASVAGFKPDANYFGIFVHKDTPQAVRETLDMVWKNVIANSDSIKKYAQSNGAQFAPVAGDDAAKGGHARDPDHGLAIARSRQVQGRARHGRHRQTVTSNARMKNAAPWHVPMI